MAILTRPKFLSQERLDLEDMNVLIESGLSDAQYFVKEFWSNSQYILKGFTVSGLGSPSPATIDLTDATLINANNTGDFSWYVAQSGASSLTAALNNNSRNYLELKLTTLDSNSLTKAFWDPSQNSGAGAEFNQTVNTVTSLNMTVSVLTGGFSNSTNTVPLAIVDTDSSNNIKLILDKRPLFFRLGTPSSPTASYSWVSQTEPPITLNLTSVTGTFVVGETVTVGTTTATVTQGGTTQIQVILPSNDSWASGNSVTGGTSGATGTLSTLTSSFTGADKSVGNLRDAYAALASEIKALKGTSLWFSLQNSSVSGLSNFINSLVVPISSGASVLWDGSNLSITDSSGTPASTDTIAKLRIFGNSGQLALDRQDGQATTSKIAIADGDVLFIKLPTSGTNQTYTGVGSGAANYQTVALASFSPSDSNYWLAYREGAKVIFRGAGELSTNEKTPIGDTIPTSLLNSLGLVDEVTAPSYSSNIRGTANESLVSRIGQLTDAAGDEQEDRSAYLRSATNITWSGTQLSFASDLILEIVNTKSGTVTQHNLQAANSPLTISNGQSIWTLINRASTTENLTVNNSGTVAIPAQTEAEKDVLVWFRCVTEGANNNLYIPFLKQVLTPNQSIKLGQAGSAGPFNIDRVLITDHTTGFITDGDASNDKTLISASFQRGTSTAGLIKEQYIDATTLTDNTSGQVLFTIPIANFCGLIMHYTIRFPATPSQTRVGVFQVAANTGNSAVEYTDEYTQTADAGVTLTANINGSNLQILASTTSAGYARTLRADLKLFRP